MRVSSLHHLRFVVLLVVLQSQGQILLRDGRHLSYKEYGVPKQIAKFKIIFLHGHSTNKKDTFLASQGLFAEFQVYIVGFDRPGYGESDPDSRRTVKSTILDVEELVDHLELGQKIHVMGYSAGGFYVWGCLKYIPHRLEGAILIAPGVNFWWPQLPSSLVEEAFHQQSSWSLWNCLIAHYSPWLMYWWNTQNYFEPKMSKYRLTELDPDEENLLDYSTQQRFCIDHIYR
ncbi:hypothetical protein Leryth_017390 [Lithospermum erythrorhizon]|nr:hypothetical protein Leryth_017390 [Lithospermum erythrorhizon]